jgi:ribonuclease R
MLPTHLSNGICSLNEGVDRLALSCLMTIDEKGNIVGHKIAETVIRVNRRMSYTSVRKILTDHDAEETAKYAEFVGMFEQMAQLSAILRKKRGQRGSIDFDLPETKMVLDEQGHPIDIKPYDRNIATRMIEDFMLAANETVAEDYFWQEIPFVYRTHDQPEPDKIRKLETFINNFGYGFKASKEEIHPKEIQKLLNRIEDTPEEMLILRLTLRSMQRAKYTTVNSGHFGLAAKYYCHFTSPIRRYPDLQIHRIIKDNLRGRMKEERRAHYEQILPAVALQSSERERRADEIERETIKLKKAEYMLDHIGETYSGVISGVTAWGIYVELPNTIEGMVHVATLADDYYHYREQSYEMVGERTGKSYKLGQNVTVQVEAVDMLMRTIDFVMTS